MGFRAPHPLRLRGPLALDHTARILHGLLLALVIWFALASAILFAIATGPPPNLQLIAVIELPLAAAIIVLRWGMLGIAAAIYLAGVWLFATAATAMNGGIRSPVLTLLVTLPISAAWLGGRRATFRATGVSMATALVFAVMEMRGGRIPAPLQSYKN